MEEIKLNVQIRNQIGRRRIKPIRREGFVPAVVYGEKKTPTLIKVEQRVYEKIMRMHKGQSVLFRLDVMDGDKKLRDYSAIVKEEQHNPVSDSLQHIDFIRISLKEEVQVMVPVLIKGEAVGVKSEGGSLDHFLWELDVICLPTNIPEKIEVDVSELKIGEAVYVKDIVLPDQVKTKHNLEDVVVSVVSAMREAAVEPEEEEAPGGVEVIKEKKDKAEENSGEAKKQ